jgi:hypothetical protein
MASGGNGKVGGSDGEPDIKQDPVDSNVSTEDCCFLFENSDKADELYNCESITQAAEDQVCKGEWNGGSNDCSCIR